MSLKHMYKYGNTLSHYIVFISKQQLLNYMLK